ncbi:MAG TPA: MerR family transcriptional regulator [Candidatus Binataceae bacterium]|nr:MerR family transcriptional regulator [Candidatus Binataceae bacterium]
MNTGEGGTARAQTFSTRAAARILAVSPDRIRYWVKHQLVSPAAKRGRRHRFAFNDLLLMRMAKELLPSRAHLKSFRLRFDGIARYFGARRPLTSLNLRSENGQILVRDGNLVFEAESGQLLLWPAGERPTGKIEDGFGPARLRARFEEARRLAESDPLRALMLYNDLIGREPRNFEVHLQMAALLEREGDLVGAMRHLHGAAMLVPANAEVHLRLGLLQRKREEFELALQSFQRATECDPLVAEAHRNLVELYERIGRKRDALRHLSTLHRLSRDN